MTPAATPEGLRRLMSQRAITSTFVKIGDLDVVDLLAASALDAIVVDLEHSQLDEGAARAVVRHAAARGLPALVRVASVEAGLINRCLEAGAVGVHLSGLETRAQVESLVAATRFPPHGRRSVSLSNPVAAFGELPLADYVRSPGGQPLIVGQIESRRACASLLTLLGDLDVAFVGTTDLAVDLGHGASPDHAEVAAAVADVARAAAATGVAFGGWVPAASRRASLVEQGARYVTVASDLAFLRAGLTDQLGSPVPALAGRSTNG